MNETLRGKGEYAFDVFNYTLMILLTILFIFPFWQVVVLSFSDPITANSLGLKLYPEKVYFDSYREVFSSKYIYIGFMNSIIRTIIGTVCTVFITYCGAYVLTKKKLPLRNFMTGMIFFTMFFSGGLIPSYLLVKNLNLIDSYWALILPVLTNAWYILVARNYISSIPDTLEEAASIDGAHPIAIAFKIIFPVCLPIIAVLALWTAVHHWNAWFDAMIYVTDRNKLVLQLVLRKMIIEKLPDMMSSMLLSETTESTTPETIKAATIVVSILPIVMVYPFLQKYFVKGIMIGSIKG
jgi:putative aldouronate transport system permease protein